MADYAAKVVNMARVLANVHIIVGSLLICFGIADTAVQFFWTGYGCWGIWMGVWMCVAGGLGIPGTRKGRSTSRDCLAGVFMGFSITSAVFGGIIIIIYSIGIATYDVWYLNRHYLDYDYYSPTENYYTRDDVKDYRHDTQMAIMALILALGIVEFATGIWAAVCLCLMKPCTCCYETTPQQEQMMYTVNPGFAVNAFTVGTSSASPMQVGSGMVAMPTATPGPQQVQPQVVMLPVSGAGGGMVAAQTVTPGSVGSPRQVVMVPVSGSLAYPPLEDPTPVATAGTMATVYQPPQVETPQSFGHGGYTRLTNEEDSLMT